MFRLVFLFTLGLCAQNLIASEIGCEGHGLIDVPVNDLLHSESNAWRIQTPAGDRGILVGITHAINPVTLARYDSLKALTIDSDIYFSESDFGSSATAMYMDSAKSASSVTSEMSPVQRQLLESKLTQTGNRIEDVANKKAWFVVTLLLRPTAIVTSIDEDIYAYESALGKKTIALEPMSQVIAELDSYPYWQDTLLDTVCSFDQVNAQVAATKKDFAKSDWRQFTIDSNRWQSQNSKFSDEFEKDLVLKRNVKIVETLKANLGSAKKFVGVLGEDHLPGKAGILALMEQAGWTVQPVTMAKLNSEAAKLEAEFLKQNPNLLPDLSKVLSSLSELKLGDKLPNAKFVSAIEMYQLACGGYKCPVEAYYSKGTLSIMSSLLPGIAKRQPQAMSPLLRELAHYAQEQNKDASWCANWRMRDIQAQNIESAYLAQAQIPSPPFTLSPPPSECN